MPPPCAAAVELVLDLFTHAGLLDQVLVALPGHPGGRGCRRHPLEALPMWEPVLSVSSAFGVSL